MKLSLKKKELVTLSKDLEALPMEMTPNVAGGIWSDTLACMTWLWHSCMSECLCDEQEEK